MRNLRTLLALGFALSLGACEFNSPAIPAAILPANGSTQEVNASAVAPTPLTVRVIDHNQDEMDGVTVNWVVRKGNGTVSAASTTTDDNGLSSVTFTAGSTLGLNEVTAEVPGLGAVSFSITVK